MGKLIFECGCTLECDSEQDIHCNKDTVLPTGIQVDIHNIPHDCVRTWDMLCEGHTKGIFQLESNLGRRWVKDIKPRNIEELAAVISLIRPGSLKAFSGDPPKSMTQRYCDRKHRLEDIEYMCEELRPILDKTYGVLTFQEQSLRIAAEIAGFSLQEADSLRKSIGKKKADLMAELKNKFIDGCKTVGIINEEQAAELFGWIQESQKYAFNKSHAVGYAEIGYWTAYLKAHFPAQFYCSYINGAKWKQDTSEEVYELVNDAKVHDVEIRTPDFRHMEMDPYIIGPHVYFGISNIKQIGNAAISRIEKKTTEVEKSINKTIVNWTWIDYLMHFSTEVSSTVNEALILCGALDYMNKSRTSMLYEFNIAKQLTNKEMGWCVNNQQSTLLYTLILCARPKKEGGGCSNVKRVKFVEGLISVLKKPPHSLNDTSDFIAWHENKYLGAPITCSKVDSCMEAARANATCKDILKYNMSGYTVLAVEVVRVNEIKTKKGKSPGQTMAFLTISDSSCSLDEVVAFPDIWKEFKHIIYEGNTLLISGEKKKSSFIVQKVWQI